MIHKETEDVRERLVKEAFAIAVAEGIDAVSTRAVCSAAGVKAPTLYHHFGDRAGLIRAVVDRAFEEYFAEKDEATSSRSTPQQQMAAGWDAHVEFARTYPRLYPAMYPVNGPSSPNLQRSAELLRAGFDRLASEGALSPGISPELADAALRAALRGVAHAIAAAPDSQENEQISAVVRDALIARLLASNANGNS